MDESRDEDPEFFSTDPDPDPDPAQLKKNSGLWIRPEIDIEIGR